MPQLSLEHNLLDIKAQKVQFLQFRDKVSRLPPGPLIVALSGGLDSCVLLHLLHLAVNQTRNPLLACYVDHGIRTGRPDGLQQYCDSLGVKLQTYRIRQGWLCRKAAQRKLSLEDLARTERYRRLQHCLRQQQRECLNNSTSHNPKGQQSSQSIWAALVLAHHADDQAESFFMNLGRGAGLRALAGMREWQISRGGALLWRPLLTWSRQNLQHWAATKGVPHWEDGSNFKQEVLRNFYRWQVLPQLKRLVPTMLRGIQRSQQHLYLLEDWLVQQRELLEAQLEFSTGAEGQRQVVWPGSFSRLAKPLQVELIFLLFDYLQRGEQRRKRLPFNFALELSNQCAKPIKAHGCLWQIESDRVLARVHNKPIQ